MIFPFRRPSYARAGVMGKWRSGAACRTDADLVVDPVGLAAKGSHNGGGGSTQVL